MKEVNTFNETQQFRQWWMWLTLALIELSVIFFAFRLLTGDVNTGRPAALFTIILVLIIPSLITVLIYIMRLETRITPEGVYVRYYPIFTTFKFYPWDGIADAYTRTYRPIREYGGYGLRYQMFRKSRAYNISGNQGIQLEFSDGNKLLIGTQKPEEAQAAIDRFFRSNRRY